MMVRSLGKFAFAVALSFMVSNAFASGTDSMGGGLSGEQAQYNAGKAVYAQKLACPGCALAGKTLDKTLAQQVVSDMGMTSKLSDDERMALMTYLKLRFKL